MTNDEIEYTGEDNPEETDLEAAEASTDDRLKGLREKLKRCEKEKAANLEDLQRAKADFLNSRKRLEEELVVAKSRFEVGYIERLLPLYDSFAMAMSNQEVWLTVPENWRVGVESIFSQLQSILNDLGAEAIDPTGEQFDPEKHEAVSSVSVEASDDGKVISVIQKGFVINKNGSESLVRPARVTVGEGK